LNLYEKKNKDKEEKKIKNIVKVRSRTISNDRKDGKKREVFEKIKKKPDFVRTINPNCFFHER
jgi:hypothetical protein